MNPTILTGLRANNDLHIGNYFGALMPMIEMATTKSDAYNIHLFIPDLHSFTTPIDHSQLQAQIMNNIRLYVAAGLPTDVPTIRVYRQSYVAAHSELAWILNCFTSMGVLGRMTQYKDKSGKLGEDSITAGLFDYPVLMAADILLYNAQYVPVGDDQTQHLEFTRDTGERFNNKFGEIFTVPVSAPEQHKFFGKGQGLRIKDLQDPSKKMSKSDESDKGIIFLGDTPATAAKKIMSATTDSEACVRYAPETQPGVANLLQIAALLRSESLEQATARYEGMTKYGEFKSDIAQLVEQFLTDYQARLGAVSDQALVEFMERSELAATEIANATLLRAQKAVGLR